MLITEVLERIQNGTIPTTDFSIMTSTTLIQSGLDNYDCPNCHNLGYIPHKVGLCGIDRETCSCMKKRISLRRLKNSGLEQLAEKYRFDNYHADNEMSDKLLKSAQQYLEEDDPSKWFFVNGIPGSGKTHICTAIAAELINREYDVYYMRWREDSVKIKQALTTDMDYYDTLMKKIKNAEVLYIDDFFKGDANNADIKLAFDILDYRYDQQNTRTIISTEYSMPELREIEDAIASRIFERAKGYICASPDKNYRFMR